LSGTTYGLAREHEQAQEDPDENECPRDDEQAASGEKSRGAHRLPARLQVQLPVGQAVQMFCQKVHGCLLFNPCRLKIVGMEAGCRKNPETDGDAAAIIKQNNGWGLAVPRPPKRADLGHSKEAISSSQLSVFPTN
jgi:hypothetical protein